MTADTWDADAFDKFEAAGWEERAADYAALLVGVTAHPVEQLLDAAGVGPGTKVLDVGAGPGHVTAACAARGATPIGLDVAHEMVAAARARHPGLDFRQGDAQRLPFADESFDAVVGNFAILHFGRPDRAVAEFTRVLVLGGRVALSTWDVPARTRMIGVFVDAAAQAGATPAADLPDGPAFFRFADEKEFIGLLRGAGLTDVSIHTFAYVHHFSGADALWDTMLRATVRLRSTVYGQPPETLALIRAAFDRLVAGHAVDGGIDMPLSVKVAAGSRG